MLAALGHALASSHCTRLHRLAQSVWDKDMCGNKWNATHYNIYYNMDLEKIKDLIGRKHNLADALGMSFVSTPDEDTCVAKMQVDSRTCQPMGLLSGGATLALAEYLAGVGSSALCPGRAVVGVNVSGSHVRSAFEGDTVTATAHIVHCGRTLHVWNVTVAGSDGKTISTVSVMNFITDKPTEAPE